MEPFLILAAHGISTPADVPFGAKWGEALDIDCEVVEARWDSTGSVVGDVFKILLNRRERNKAVGAITSALHDFVERDGPKLLLAHSMGEPLLLEAVRRVQPDLPIITIGGPLSHPFFGNTLATVGLRKPTPGDAPLRFWNRHDGVCCSRFFGARQPAWMNATRIAVAGDTGWVVEHAAVLYLENDNVRRAVRALREST